MTKVTKRSLLTSALALVVCVSMLIGTTYAWFTDSVTSTNNIITSGNLDVELYYQVEGQTDWTKVTSTSNIFKADALWEPGHTEVVKLKVVNEGTLALKYNLGINVASETTGINVDNKTLKLSDYIMYGTAEVANYTRETAIEAVEANAIKLNVPTNKNGSLEPGKEYTTTMVVYMPTTVGNEANYKKGFAVPTINLGINLFATQLMAEKDSFGDDYDVNATWIGIIPESLDETTLEIVPVDKAKTGTITINSAEDLVYLNKLAKEWVSLYSNGNGTSVTNYYVNNGGKGSDYYYHSQWTIELAADLDMNNIPMDSIDITYWGNFNGNGHTISNVVLNEGQIGLFNNDVKAISNLTVKNIVVTAPKANTVGAVANKGSMNNVHVENATVIGGKYVGGICGKGSSFINCSIKNSTVTGNDKTVGGLVGYSVGDPGTATVSGNVVENVAVTGAYNVGGLLGQAQNETVENNTVKNVTVKSTLELPGNASSNEVRTAEVAARSAFANTTIGTNTVENVTLVNVTNVSDNAGLNNAIASGKTEIALGSGNYTMPGATSGKTVTIVGNGETVIDITTVPTYTGLSGATITFENVIINSDPQGAGYNRGFAHTNKVTYNNCVINGTLGLYADTEFNNCTFNISGDYYNIWTWGAPNVTLNGCVFNSDGKALLLYGTANTKLTVNNCTFNDNGGLTDLKAAIEIGNDYNKSYELIVNNTTVNGYEINDKGINTGSTLWGNKNSMGTDKLNVVIDGVDVY